MLCPDGKDSFKGMVSLRRPQDTGHAKLWELGKSTELSHFTKD